jgi:putative ABC transport system substrate-binding protein
MFSPITASRLGKVLVAVLVVGGAIAAYSLSANRGAPTRLVAIATLVPHPALDALQEAVKNELAAQGFREGEQIRYEVRNANGQMQLLSSIATELASLQPDVTVAITTPVAQTVQKTTRGPVVFSAVTDPVGAGLVASLEATSRNLTGATDAWPYEDQLKLIREITPNVRRLAVVFNPAEAASQYGMRLIRQFAPRLGLELVEGAVSNTSDVFSVTTSLIANADAVYLSSDSTAIGGVAGALRAATNAKKPLYVGDSGTVKKGGLAAVSIGYAQLGTETGKLVARVLRGEHNIPIVNPQGSEVIVNLKAAELMGVVVPPSVTARATILSEISE